MSIDPEVLGGAALGGGVVGYLAKELIAAVLKSKNGNGTTILEQRMKAVEDKCTEVHGAVQVISAELRQYSMTVASAIADHGARLTVIERRRG